MVLYPRGVILGNGNGRIPAVSVYHYPYQGILSVEIGHVENSWLVVTSRPHERRVSRGLKMA